MQPAAISFLWASEGDQNSSQDVAITSKILLIHCKCWAAKIGTRIGTHAGDHAQSRIQISITECLLQGGKRRFTGTVTGFDAHVSGGKVVLTGATTDEKLIVEAVRLSQGVEGVERVESRITHIAFASHRPE